MQIKFHKQLMAVIIGSFALFSALLIYFLWPTSFDFLLDKETYQTNISSAKVSVFSVPDGHAAAQENGWCFFDQPDEIKDLCNKLSVYKFRKGFSGKGAKTPFDEIFVTFMLKDGTSHTLHLEKSKNNDYVNVYFDQTEYALNDVEQISLFHLLLEMASGDKETVSANPLQE